MTDIEKLLEERQLVCLGGMHHAVLTQNKETFDVNYELYLGTLLIAHSRGIKQNEALFNQVDNLHKKFYGWR